MNFGMIFLCLGIGAVVGFEFGKYMESRKIREALKMISDGMKETVERAQQRKQTSADDVKQHGNYILARMGVEGFSTRQYQMTEEDWENATRVNRKEELDICSKLIAAMTLKGATECEIGRAVRYSMVVIDTDKLRLDWKRSQADEGIRELENKYMREEVINNGEGT